MLSPKLRHFLLGCALLAPSAASADPLYVTITKFFTPLDEVGSSVSVITEDELEAREVRTLPDALRTVPGLSVVQSGPTGTITSVFMRGANSNQVLVLLNGNPVGDPSAGNGAFGFSQIPAADIERIEVLRGPASALYGSRAMGGVINIITKEGQGPVKISGLAEVGTRNSLTTTASAQGSVEGIGFNVTLSRLATDGFSITPERLLGPLGDSESDGHESLSASGSLNFALGENLKARVGASVIDTETELDPFLEDPDALEKARTYFLDAGLEGNYYDGFWQPSLNFAFSDYSRHNTDERQDPFGTLTDDTNEGQRWSLEQRNALKLDERNTLTFGAIYEYEEFNADSFNDFGGFVVSGVSDGARGTGGIYLSHRYDLDGRLILNGSVRYDLIENGDDAFSFSFTPLYKFAETGTTLKGSVGTGFKAPALFQLYGFTADSCGGTFVGNPNLKPERSFGWEVGAEQALLDGRLNIGATYFQSAIKDAIQTAFTFCGASTTVNNQDLFVRGAEFFVSYAPSPWVSLGLNYTLTDTELNDSSGAQALRRPRHQFSASAQMDITGELHLDLRANYIGERADIDYLTGAPVTQPSYLVVDIAASYDISENFSLFARASNLLGEDYETANGFAGPSTQLFVGVKASY